MNSSYHPNTLVLTLSRQCNLDCIPCIVEAERRRGETLNIEIVDSVLSQAKMSGFQSVVLYGGEPFLHYKTLLPTVLSKTFEAGIPLVSIATNGFWGRTKTQAEEVLSNMEMVSAAYDGRVGVGLSVDEYHQPSIPVKSISNIISTYRFGSFPHIELGIQTFIGQKSHDVVGGVFDACERENIMLIESNDRNFVYPALRDEFIKYSQENLPLIIEKLKLPIDSDSDSVLSWIRNHLGAVKALNGMMAPKVIARCLDTFDGVDTDYLVFPLHNFIMEYHLQQVLNAGRARKNGPLEMGGERAEPNYLVIAPNGEAYAYSAQITAGRGIPVKDKCLDEVIQEVGRTML